LNDPGAAPGPGGVWTRPARSGDVGALVQMYALARQELAALRGGAVLLGLGGRPADVAASFEAQLGDPRCLVAVAFLGAAGGEACGYGTATVLPLAPPVVPPLGEGELLGSIDELYVKPDQRRQGVGRLLAGQLIEWCQAKGAGSIDAKALPGSRAVKSFFEAEGFTARLLVMHRRLA
jgi:GNAT superfamily N-acetyltransferase